MSAVLVLILRILLAIALYAFLAFVLYTLWQEIRLSGFLASGKKIPAITIANADEPGEGLVFNQPEVIIGRDAACEYTITDETVSARHARLSFHHNQWWIEDLKSTNGSFLNEEPLETPTVILSGDSIRCGKVDLTVTIKQD